MSRWPFNFWEPKLLVNIFFFTFRRPGCTERRPAYIMSLAVAIPAAEESVRVSPRPPREPWSWWRRWQTVAGWSWGRRAAASCTRHRLETSPVRHETASPRLPATGQVQIVRLRAVCTEDYTHLCKKKKRNCKQMERQNNTPLSEHPPCSHYTSWTRWPSSWCCS